MAQFTNQAQLAFRNTVVNSNVAVGEILEPLTAEKIAVPETYTSGDTITYVISMVNSGPAALSAITVTDNLGAYQDGSITRYPLTYVPSSVRLFVDGILQVAPSVTAGESLVFSNISLPAGADLILLYQTTVNGFAPLFLEGFITNTATINGSGIVTPITVSAIINAATVPMLEITKSIEPIPVAENGTVTYTFVIRNYGNVPTVAEDNLTLTDLFDPILIDITATLDGALLASPADYTYDVASGRFATVPGRIALPAATFSTDPTTGEQITTPGTSVLTITGRIS